MSLITCSPAVTGLTPITPDTRHAPRLRPPPVLSPSSFPACTAIPISRRASVLALFPFLLLPSPSPAIAAPPSDGGDGLERYTDETEGFTLLIPASWAKVEKAGATALFEQGKNNIGVVVNPVRLSSLREFGTPDFVADKLLQAERKKESTKSVELIETRERLGHGDVPVYEIEYKLDSTRGGMKRILSAAFVSSKKLHLLNIAYSDSLDNPLNGDTRMVLEEILHSFDAL